jgi:hypothetical protein
VSAELQQREVTTLLVISLRGTTFGQSVGWLAGEGTVVPVLNYLSIMP